MCAQKQVFADWLNGDFFLEPKLLLAVGLAGGCELMGAAIGALLSEHVGWVDVAADAVRCGVLSSRTFRIWRL